MDSIYNYVKGLYYRMKPYKSWIYALLILTSFLLILLRLLFYDQSLYVLLQNVPDFLRLDKLNTAGLREYVSSLSADPSRAHKFLWYKLYFIVDLVFPILLFGSALLIQKVFTKRAALLLSLALFATLVDWLENFSFLFLNVKIEHLDLIQNVKFGSYGSFFIIWFYNIYQRHLKKDAVHYFKGIAASILSILLAIIFAVLMTSMDQGTSLVIEMLTSPWNFSFFYLLIVFASIIISHYPRFIYEFLFPTVRYEWKLNWIGVFPIIYFNTKEQNEQDNIILSEVDSNKSKVSKQIFTFVRHYLGSFIILSIIYVLLFTYLKVFHEKPGLFASQFTILLGIIVIWFQNYLSNLERQCVKSSKSLEDSTQREAITVTKTVLLEDFKKVNSETFKKTKIAFLLLNFLIVVQFVLIVLRFFMEHEWHRFNIGFAIFQFICMLFGYVIFREYRSILKFRYDLSGNFKIKSNSNPEKPQEPLINGGGIYLRAVLKEHFFIPFSRKMPIIGNFSNNEFFILVSILITVFVAIVVVSFSLFNTVQLNAANYLLSYILLYYGIIIFVLKGIFYSEKNKDDTIKMTMKRFPSVTRSYVALVALCLIIYGFTRGNDLHLLPELSEQNKSIGLNEFRDRIVTAPMDTSVHKTYKSIFNVASFGGGLKANYYTLKVLDKIQKETKGEFMRSTVSLSGVSGGGVGLANYYLLDGFVEEDDIDQKIQEIGQLDILSIDCSYLMFQDFWREIIPGFKYTDRSHRGMLEYKKVILEDIDKFDKYSYRDVYSKILDNKGYYPTLLMNSTSTKLQYGIANSIESMTLPGAIDILDIRVYDKKNVVHSKSLAYYDAVSTINRFPIFSPAAEITNKGHFVDGGYFENSGMLSSLSYLDRLAKGEWAVHEKMILPSGERQVVMINLINSKTHWINHILQEVYDKNDYIRKSSESTELTAIINTVVETEMLPNYFIQLLKQKTRDSLSEFTFIPIYMPFTVQYEDIVEYLKGEPVDPERLMDSLAIKNTQIMNILKNNKNAYNYDRWGLVEPALSRNLSEPDRIYQDVMIDEHPYIQMQVEKIKSMMYN